MALLDDIQTAKTGVSDRANTLADQITKGNPRYSFDNADQANSWQGRWLGSDRTTLKQLDLLSAAVNDPAWTQKVNAQADTQGAANNASLDESYRVAGGRDRAAAEAAGRAGGSWEAVGAAQRAAQLGAAKAQVAQHVSELKAAGIQNLEQMGQQLLGNILGAGDQSNAQSTSLSSAQGDSTFSQMQAQNDAQYHNLLSQSIGGFLNNAAVPLVAGGFQSADRYNTLQRQNYMDARDTGALPAGSTFANYAAGNGGTRSWWGY